MKSYYDLIKENVINFRKALLDKYYELGLNETECIVLIRLQEYAINVNNELNSQEIVKKLSIDVDELGEVLVNLVNKDFVSLSYDPNTPDALESFTLDGAYRQLGYVFEGKDSIDAEKTKAIEMKQTLQVLEKKLNKILTPLEVSIVKKWFYDYNYKLDIINDEIEKVCARRVKSVGIIDRELFAKTKETTSDDDALKAKELFEKLYGTK